MSLGIRIGISPILGSVATFGRFVANWILSLLTNDDTTVVNQTVLAWDIDAVTADGMTLFVLDDDTAGLPGAVWDSIAKVWSFRRADGELVGKLIEPTPNTPAGAIPTLDALSMVDRVNDESITDGDIRRVMTTEGLNVWVIYNGSGTADSSLPTTSISDIGGAAITDNDTEYIVQGLQTAEGLFSGLEATNLLPYSQDLTTDRSSVGITVTGDTAIAPDGTMTADNVAATASTNHIRNLGATVVADTKYTYSWWGGDLSSGVVSYRIWDVSNVAEIASATYIPSGSRNTVTFTTPIGCTSVYVYPVYLLTTGQNLWVWGEQLDLGEVASPYIPTEATTVTRTRTVTSTPIAETKLEEAGSFILITAVPDRAGQTGALASTFTDALNSTDVLINSTDITLRKRIATVDNDAVISYTHASDTPFAVIAIWDGTNMRVTAADVGGTFPAYETNGNTADAIIGPLLESFSRDEGEQTQGDGIYVSSFTSEAQLIAFVDANGVASTANL